MSLPESIGPVKIIKGSHTFWHKVKLQRFLHPQRPEPPNLCLKCLAELAVSLHQTEMLSLARGRTLLMKPARRPAALSAVLGAGRRRCPRPWKGPPGRCPRCQTSCRTPVGSWRRKAEALSAVLKGPRRCCRRDRSGAALLRGVREPTDGARRRRRRRSEHSGGCKVCFYLWINRIYSLIIPHPLVALLTGAETQEELKREKIYYRSLFMTIRLSVNIIRYNLNNVQQRATF